MEPKSVEVLRANLKAQLKDLPEKINMAQQTTGSQKAGCVRVVFKIVGSREAVIKATWM